MTRFIKLVFLIFAASCNLNTASPNKMVCDCDIIYGHKSDWDIISDDLARNIYKHNLRCKNQS